MALFDNNEELKQLNSAFTASFELNSILSFLDDAAGKTIIPAVSLEMYTDLLSKKQSLMPGSLNARLLHLVQKACLSLAMGNYAAFGSLQIQDSGITVLSRDNARPASDAKVAQLRKQSFAVGYEALEEAVELLESHLDEFPSYAASTAHTGNRSLFINSSKEFSAAAGVTISAQVFRELRSELARLERDSIEPLLGEALTQDIRIKISTGKPEEKDKS